MSDDKIAEIRARHSRDDRWRNLPSMICPQAHDDRALLLAEIERLNKDLATQQGCCDGAAAQDAHVRQEREEHRAEVERLRREIKNLREAMQNLAERLEVDPSGTDKIDDLEAEIERLREGNERLRKALQDIAEDCDDDYPPSHGAIKYAVQDALRDKP